LIYYTISALENSNKFFKVILWLSLLMFSFISTLLLIISSSSPPKHSGTSSPCSAHGFAIHQHAKRMRTPRVDYILQSFTGETVWLAFCRLQSCLLHCYRDQKLGDWGNPLSAGNKRWAKEDEDVHGRASEKTNTLPLFL